jgi:hypothetical protein
MPGAGAAAGNLSQFAATHSGRIAPSILPKIQRATPQPQKATAGHPAGCATTSLPAILGGAGRRITRAGAGAPLRRCSWCRGASVVKPRRQVAGSGSRRRSGSVTIAQ